MSAQAETLEFDEDFDEALDLFAEDDEHFDDENRRHSFFSTRFRPTRISPLAPPVPGVQSATLTTPRGSANLRLPEPVVTERVFREAIQKLETTLRGVTSDLASLNASTTRAHRTLALRQQKLAKATRDGLARIKKQQATQAMMSLLVTMMIQKDQQQKLTGHTHKSDGSAEVTGANNSTMLMMLPLMMMPNALGGQNGGGDNNMMMFFMVLALSGGLGK
jgi:hypothetical protein